MVGKKAHILKFNIESIDHDHDYDLDHGNSKNITNSKKGAEMVGQK